jgi:hypothetical protein
VTGPHAMMPLVSLRRGADGSAPAGLSCSVSIGARLPATLIGGSWPEAEVLEGTRLFRLPVPSRPGRDRDTARATLGQGLAVSAFPRSVPV